MKRRPNPQRVRETLAEAVQHRMGEEIVSMRKAMQRAAQLIDSDPEQARRELLAALAENWWK